MPARYRPAAMLLGGILALISVAVLQPAQAAEDDFDFELTELVSDEVLTFEELSLILPLVVHVWAPDCPHCKVHMPYAAALYEKLDLSEVNYITLAVSGSEEEVEDYLEERELDFPVLWWASGEYTERWEELGWPTTYVFAPGGVYVGWCDILGPAYITEMQELIERAEELGYSDAELGLDDLRYKSSRSGSSSE